MTSGFWTPGVVIMFHSFTVCTFCTVCTHFHMFCMLLFRWFQLNLVSFCCFYFFWWISLCKLCPGLFVTVSLYNKAHYLKLRLYLVTIYTKSLIAKCCENTTGCVQVTSQHSEQLWVKIGLDCSCKFYHVNNGNCQNQCLVYDRYF